MIRPDSKGGVSDYSDPGLTHISLIVLQEPKTSLSTRYGRKYRSSGRKPTNMTCHLLARCHLVLTGNEVHLIIDWYTANSINCL
jgi:hypothetical protein